MNIDLKYRAACVQAAPVYFDKDGGVAKTIDLIDQAVAADAKLVAFPKSLIQN